MRFEIKAGGLIAILLGLAALSGAVFVMGLTAGYDVGRQTQIDAQKAAVEYPVAQASEPGAASTAGAAAPATVVARAASPVPAATMAAPVTPPKEVAEPEMASNPNPPVEDGVTPPTPAEVASPVATKTASLHRHFNVTVQAAMDANSAAQMIQRLQTLGYHPRRVATSINGQTWFKVQVGPYATREEATAAEEQMRQQYNSSYSGGSGVPAGPPGTGSAATSSGSSEPPEE